MNVIKFDNNNLTDENENLYLYFNLGGSKYAVNILQVVEIVKLPMLDYPQKLSSNIVGLLNYNNFTINVLDLRFYLDIKVTPYSVSNQLLIVKTDESIFGLVIDKVEDIITFEPSLIEYFSMQGENKVIDFLYKKDGENISVINLNSIDEMVRSGFKQEEIDIPSLFPQDDDSRYKLMQRNQALLEKSALNITPDMLSQDKFISFELDENIYCISLEHVKEFFKNCQITKIPCNLSYIAGVMTLRGDFITVVNTKDFLNNKSETSNNDSEKNNIIIVDARDFSLGFIVDKIYSIIDIPEELIRENIKDYQNKFILSEVIMDNKLYTILNMNKVLSDERFYIEN